MKRKMLLICIICLPIIGQAQVLKVGSIKKIDLPNGPTKSVVGLSPVGDYILLSTASNNGLVKFDLSTGKTQELTSGKGTGFNVKISNDGKQILYPESSYSKNNLRRVSLNAIDLSTGKTQQLVKPSRNLQGYSIGGATVSVVKDNKQQLTRLQPNAIKRFEMPTLSIKNRQLLITKGGKTQVFSPNGKQFSYIWPSVSPDGTKALYYVCGVGAFVCDMNGSNLKSLGTLRAPRWYNNDVIIGMNDQDDGEYVYASSIVAKSLSGQEQVLTDDSVIAMYPYATLKGDKIVFSTPAGEAYMIDININN